MASRLTRLASHQIHDPALMPCDKTSNASKAQLNPCVTWKMLITRRARLGLSDPSTVVHLKLLLSQPCFRLPVQVMAVGCSGAATEVASSHQSQNRRSACMRFATG